MAFLPGWTKWTGRKLASFQRIHWNKYLFNPFVNMPFKWHSLNVMNTTNINISINYPKPNAGILAILLSFSSALLYWYYIHSGVPKVKHDGLNTNKTTKYIILSTQQPKNNSFNTDKPTKPDNHSINPTTKEQPLQYWLTN